MMCVETDRRRIQSSQPPTHKSSSGPISRDHRAKTTLPTQVTTKRRLDVTERESIRSFHNQQFNIQPLIRCEMDEKYFQLPKLESAWRQTSDRDARPEQSGFRAVQRQIDHNPVHVSPPRMASRTVEAQQASSRPQQKRPLSLKNIFLTPRSITSRGTLPEIKSARLRAVQPITMGHSDRRVRFAD